MPADPLATTLTLDARQSDSATVGLAASRSGWIRPEKPTNQLRWVIGWAAVACIL